jgi:hypothetical protein
MIAMSICRQALPPDGMPENTLPVWGDFKKNAFLGKIYQF